MKVLGSIELIELNLQHKGLSVVYLIHHIIDNKFYIGETNFFELDYYGSGKHVKNINRAQRANVLYRYLIFVEIDKQKRLDLESEYITKFREYYGENKVYNIKSRGTIGALNKKHKTKRKQTAEQIAAKSGNNHSLYGKFGSEHPTFGVKHSADAILKNSIAHTGEKNGRAKAVNINGVYFGALKLAAIEHKCSTVYIRDCCNDINNEKFNWATKL